MLIDIWCRIFEGNVNERKNLLEFARPLVQLSEDNDLTVFNYWARKEGLQEIK